MNKPEKIKTRLLCLIFAVCIIAGCAGQSVETGTVPVDPGTSAEISDAGTAGSESVVLVDGGAFQYSFIRASDMSDVLISAVSATYRKLREKTGAEIEYTDDFLMLGKEPDASKKEILIGKTNRPESGSVFAELRALDWFVGRVGEKIVICGGTEEATRRALSYFDGLLDGLEPADRMVLEGLEENHTSKANYRNAQLTIAGRPASDFTVYSSTLPDEDGPSVASYFNQMLSESTGDLLVTKRGGSADRQPAIYIGSVNAAARELIAKIEDETAWTMTEIDGNLYLSGKNSWALRAACTALLNDFVYKDAPVPSGFSASGSSMGIKISEKTPGSTLRIMTNNVWSCDNNQAAWIAMGENCSAQVRAVGFARVYTAYMPDVINTQEMTAKMLQYILSNMEKFGVRYNSLAINSPVADYTALIYNPETVTLEKSGHHVFDYGSNSNSKGYTWGYFKLNATGEHFISLSTHLWWKSESTQAGSNEWRERQAAEIVALAGRLENQYGCPVFIQGDLNTQTTSKAFSVLTDGGFQNCQKIATVSRDDLRGYHSCSPDGFSTELSSGTYTANGIDHMLVRNLGNAEVMAFHHIIVDFYAKLSDHYPVYIDVKLG